MSTFTQPGRWTPVFNTYVGFSSSANGGHLAPMIDFVKCFAATPQAAKVFPSTSHGALVVAKTRGIALHAPHARFLLEPDGGVRCSFRDADGCCGTVRVPNLADAMGVFTGMVEALLRE